MFTDIIFSAFRNLKRKKLRSFLTMLGIIIGVTSVATVLSIGNGGKKAITNEFDRFGLNGLSIRGVISSSGKKGELKADEVMKINSKVKEATQVMPVVYNYGQISEKSIKKECVIWGIGANAKETISLTPIYGQNLSISDINTASYTCLIDTTLAKQIFKRENIVGKKINVLINGAIKSLTIKGVINGNGSLLTNIAGEYIPSFIYIPYSTLQKLYGIDYYDQVIVNIKEGKDLDTIGRKITTLLSRTNNIENGYFADNMVKQKEKIENILNIITAIISAVAAVSLIVGGLGIMTIMLVAVSERTREIGIKKAVGATKKMIVSEFVAEAIAITVTGGIIGIGLTIAISSIANNILGFSTELNLGIMFIALIFSIIIGIIFSVYPAKKAAELNPISALRYE